MTEIDLARNEDKQRSPRALEPDAILSPDEFDLAQNSSYAQDRADGGADTLEHITPPGVLATVPELLEFTDRWLENRRLSELTRLAYRRNLEDYLMWCEAAGVRPLEARFTHVNRYARHLEENHAPRTVARALSAVSSWYRFLVRLGALAANPADGADRPVIDRDDTTAVGFTPAEAAAIAAAARADKPLGPLCATALAETLVALGPRASELCRAAVADLGYRDGHRTLRLRWMKGGKKRTRALPPPAVVALEAMLEARPDGRDPDAPLFRDAAGRPLDRHAVYRFVRRAARAAKVPGAAEITPHSFRHAWATAAKLAGATLEDRQHALGHADSRTTQGYDRAKESLDRDPSYLVAAAVASAAARVREDEPHAA